MAKSDVVKVGEVCLKCSFQPLLVPFTAFHLPLPLAMIQLLCIEHCKVATGSGAEL